MISRASKRLFSSSIPRLDTLVYLESSGAKINPAALSSVTAAIQIGEPVVGLTTSEEIESEASKIEGLSKIVSVSGDQYKTKLAEELAPLFKDIIQSDSKFTHFIVPASAVGKSSLPRLGALLDVQPISDIVKVESSNTFVRPIYAGNALATVKSNDSIILASVRASAFAPATAGEKQCEVEKYSGTISDSGNRTQFVSESLITSERPELGSASKIVSGGRGLKNKETFEALIEPLATKLGAAIGASRAAVDSGFCDNSLQVGQTGKIVAPELYVAVGISGAIQHLAGMKDSKTIVAINKNPDEPIFNIADVGFVADLNEVVPELTSKL